ncbi:hypothetical protein [Dyella silvae]|uniref:hypothetical protein n=1 Tax=Dyella silvae TaxID=2994424 RepID=UPI00226427B7|nr:hypothetical protein [Dyella silvae]
MVKLLAWSLLAAVASPAAFGACAGDYSLPGEYKWSEAVITGLVTDAHLIEDKDDPEVFAGILYSVRLDHVYKGNLPSVAKIYSENNSGRFPMELGKRYVLFLHKSGPNLSAYDCGNSGPVDEKAAVIKFLKSS